MNRVPKSRVIKLTKIDSIVIGLVSYVVLSIDAKNLLMKEKRITPVIDFKIMTEVALIRNLLFVLLEVTEEEFKARIDEVKKSPEHEKRVAMFADDLAPKKSVLVTPEEFAEQKKQARMFE